jgi:sensor domain CHASE-containing protein
MTLKGILIVTGARRIGLMNDFILSILVSIGIVVVALGIVAWLTLRRVREEEARTE